MITSHVRLITGHEPFALSPTCCLVSSDPWCRYFEITICRSKNVSSTRKLEISSSLFFKTHLSMTCCSQVHLSNNGSDGIPLSDWSTWAWHNNEQNLKFFCIQKVPWINLFSDENNLPMACQSLLIIISTSSHIPVSCCNWSSARCISSYKVNFSCWSINFSSRTNEYTHWIHFAWKCWDLCL